MPLITLANLIDGQLQPPVDGRYLDIPEPATGSVFARCPASGKVDVATAVEAARRAAPGWAATPAAERARHIQRLSDLLEARLEDFVAADSRDNGKPLALARKVDIPRAVANLRYFAAAIQAWDGQSH